MVHADKNTKNGKRKHSLLSSRLGWYFFMVMFVIMASPAVTAQNNTADINWLVEVLELEEGSVVADIGAGDGDLTLELARHVGPEGNVYSSELGSESLQRLRKAVESSAATNITVVEGHPSRTNLPEACCDALFMRNVYHHFDDPPSMNTSLWQSLKPAGRLAVIDFAPRGSESTDPAGRSTGDQHGVTAETVVEELTQAGFDLISVEKRSDRGIYVVVRKPEND